MKRDLIILSALLLLALPGFNACAGGQAPPTPMQAEPAASTPPLEGQTSPTSEPEGQASPAAAQGGMVADMAGLLDGLRAAG